MKVIFDPSGIHIDFTQKEATTFFDCLSAHANSGPGKHDKQELLESWNSQLFDALETSLSLADEIHRDRIMAQLADFTAYKIAQTARFREALARRSARTPAFFRHLSKNPHKS